MAPYFEFEDGGRIDSILRLRYRVLSSESPALLSPICWQGAARILNFLSIHRARATATILIALVLLLPPSSSARPETVLLPFRSVHSLILVEAKLNGNPVTLLLDTGANNTILDVKAYGNTLLSPIQPVSKGAGIVGNALRVRVDLEIAHRFLFSQPVSVMNLDGLARQFGTQFDGLLGQDVLRQFRSVRINYKSHVIELEP
jgi:hypothetical protein